MAGAALTMGGAIRLCRRMGSMRDYRKPLKACRVLMLSGIKKCFAAQTTPDGVPWPKLKPGTIRGRRKGGAGAKALRDTDILYNSMTGGGGRGVIRILKPGKVVVGSNLEYAAVHNYGYPAGNIPARTYCGHRPENIPKYEKILVHFAEREFLR